MDEKVLTDSLTNNVFYFILNIYYIASLKTDKSLIKKQTEKSQDNSSV